MIIAGYTCIVYSSDSIDKALYSVHEHVDMLNNAIEQIRQEQQNWLLQNLNILRRYMTGDNNDESDEDDDSDDEDDDFDFPQEQPKPQWKQDIERIQSPSQTAAFTKSDFDNVREQVKDMLSKIVSGSQPTQWFINNVVKQFIEIIVTTKNARARLLENKPKAGSAAQKGQQAVQERFKYLMSVESKDKLDAKGEQYYRELTNWDELKRLFGVKQ